MPAYRNRSLHKFLFLKIFNKETRRYLKYTDKLSSRVIARKLYKRDVNHTTLFLLYQH